MKNKETELKVVVNPDSPLSDTERELREKCVAQEEAHVRRDFTPEKIAEFKDELSAKTIIAMGKKKQKKALVSVMDAEIKGLDEEIKSNADKIKDGYEETLETVYLIDDQEKKVMNYVDKDGNIVSSRPLLRSERQLNIVSEAANS